MSVRKFMPVRSDVAPEPKYQNFKPDLRRDFSSRCGYCDALDQFFGGMRGYHIDHFAPKSKFPALELIYTNLVYSCPFCNRAKSNKWVGEDASVANNGSEGFVDPCDRQFDNHLSRDNHGRIVALTVLGAYMIQQLNLHLLRHQFIWQTQKLEELEERLDDIITRAKECSDSYVELLESYREVNRAYKHYRRQAIEA